MPVKQVKYPERLFKKTLEAGFPTALGLAAAILLVSPNWSFFDPDFLFLVGLLICWLFLLAYRDIRTDRNYTTVWSGFEDQIYNTKNALDILETIPASRSKRLATILHEHEQMSSEEFVQKFLQSTEGIDKIVEAVTEYLARRRESDENQVFRASFAVPKPDNSSLVVMHSHAKRSSNPPAKGQEFGPHIPDTNDTTVMRAWTSKRPVAIPDVEAVVRASERSGQPAGFHYLNDDEKANLKSILCIPISSTDGPAGQEFHGVLSIDTNVKGFFREVDVMQEYRWCKILAPFLERVVFYARLSRATEVVLSQ